MIDFHCHALPGIDDGSESLKESLEIVKNASRCGVTDLVVTPHFIFGSTYNATNEQKRGLFERLKLEVQKQNLPINLYLGNEVYVERNMLDLLKEEQIATLNYSKYLLFELPMNNEYKGLKDIVFQLKVNGIIPVLAHPERYSYFQKHPEFVMELSEQGVLFQSNVGSFYGRYGSEAKKLFLLLLEHRMIHFLCTDTHHEKDLFYDQVDHLKKDLRKYITVSEIEELFHDNAEHILKNEDFIPREAIPLKKTFFGKWK